MRQQRQQIEAAFAALGLRASVQPFGFPAYAETDVLVRVRVLEDGDGPYFDIRFPPQLFVELGVTGTQPRLRRLVLEASDGVTTARFVCGRDDEGLFVEPLEPTEAMAGV